MVHTFPQVIEHSAHCFPNKEAFRCGKAAFTYDELNTKTTQLAHFFIKKGIKKGDRIGVYLNRCLDTALAIYGIMKAGAVYVPLDPTAPTHRTRFLLEDCGINYIVSNKTQRRKLATIVTEDVNLAGIVGLSMDWKIPTIAWETIFQIKPKPLTTRILEHDLAYIIYTSGSTGAPKGIMHTHHSGLAYAKLTADLYQLTHKDRIGNHAPLHFDISTLGYFSSPFVGATTIIVSDAHTKLPASLSALIEKEKISVWYSVPLALVQILQKGIIEKKDFTALRWILFGGEPFPLKHLRKLMEYLPQATFSNVYGPAEVNQCTYYNFKTLSAIEESVPLGQIWDNTDGLVVDESDNIIADGGVGELLIRSATRMAGYWNQPQLTEKSLYRKQIAIGFEEIYYRTGDLVQRRADGNLLFLGRKDRQIKIRGYRVELDEVEATILTHEKIEEAATFVMIVNDEKTIEAAVILKSNLILSVEDLYKNLHQHLPNYAVPHKITILQDFPRTSTGKINRQALRQQLKNKST